MIELLEKNPRIDISAAHFKRQHGDPVLSQHSCTALEDRHLMTFDIDFKQVDMLDAFLCAVIVDGSDGNFLFNVESHV